MNLLVKRILHGAGGTLALAGIMFVAFRLSDYNTQLNFSHFNSLMWSVVTGFTLIYGLANIMLALAWRGLLLHFGTNIHWLLATKIYGLTQLAKYVPGNIMHLVSRQAIGLVNNIRGWSLAKTSMWEFVLLAITGMFFSILLLPQFLPIITAHMAIVGFVSILLIVALILKRYIGINIVQVFGWYVAFLVISGMVFVGLLQMLMTENFMPPLQMLTFCGAFIIAWLAGLVTPGAPAGVGVRELVLIVLLKGLVPESDLLLAILLSRLVTVGGDVMFFLFALFLSYLIAEPDS